MMNTSGDQQLTIDVNELIKTMIEQKRLREEQMRNLVDKLIEKGQGNQTTT